MNKHLAGPLLILFATAVTLAGTIYAKEWADKQRLWVFLLSQALYLAGALAWPFALRYGGFAIINAVASVAMAFVTVVIGVTVYKEKLGLLHGVGIGIALVALIILSIPAPESKGA
jgi:uncharacterized membrane protein